MNQRRGYFYENIGHLLRNKFFAKNARKVVDIPQIVCYFI
jgi:hypothetical protein